MTTHFKLKLFICLIRALDFFRGFAIAVGFLSLALAGPIKLLFVGLKVVRGSW